MQPGIVATVALVALVELAVFWAIPAALVPMLAADIFAVSYLIGPR